MKEVESFYQAMATSMAFRIPVGLLGQAWVRSGWGIAVISVATLECVVHIPVVNPHSNAYGSRWGN